MIYFQIFNIISYEYFFAQIYYWTSFTKHTNFLGEKLRVLYIVYQYANHGFKMPLCIENI